jgi:hypothetical protein
MSTTNADDKPQSTVMEELLRFLFFAEDRESAKHAATLYSGELAKLQAKTPRNQIVYQWTVEGFCSPSKKERLQRLQENGPCYLHHVIPRSLLSINTNEKVVRVELAGQHWLLLLRMLTETEWGEADQDGDTIFHLAARAKLWKVLFLADRKSLITMNKKQESPIYLIKKTQQRFLENSTAR